MEQYFLNSIRNQLIERKSKLEHLSSTPKISGNLYDLLIMVDRAIERIDTGSYGYCEVCKDPIETERLLADPLMTLCIDHLSEAQQRALERDLADAGKIQRALLPEKLIKIDGWEFAYHYSPAGIVSGDFCDFIPTRDDSFIFVLGDVSGKGLPASLMMSHLHALLHTLAAFDLPVNEIIYKANRLFCESTVNANYATLVAGKALPDGFIDICVAGHNPPLIISGGVVNSINATGMPVGIFSEAAFDVERVVLGNEDSLVLYTDGITEASVDDVEYGEKKLIECLSRGYSSGTEELLKSIIRDHTSFLGSNPAGDDITLAVLKRKF